MFSLCIPTMDRFDSFLKKYLQKYLTYVCVSEIVITDENGKDVDRIQREFSLHPFFYKLVLVNNEARLGPFLNKIKCCRLSTNPYIALVDSDNFVSENYFVYAKDFIRQHCPNQQNVVIAPVKASPSFDFTPFIGKVIRRGTIQECRKLPQFDILMNVGNYIFHRQLVDRVQFEDESFLPRTTDALFMNTLWIEQLDMQLHVVPKMDYEHVVHSGSNWVQMHTKYEKQSKEIYERFYRIG